MSLFPDALLEDLRRLSGGDHSFLKQLAHTDGAPLLEQLEDIRSRVDPAIGARWDDRLRSLDNRRFFQGYAEAAVATLLLGDGWTLEGMSEPGNMLAAVSPDGQAVDVLVSAYIRQLRPLPDRAVIQRLAHAINRAGSRSRLVVLVRRWLPHDFQPEPVRRAVEMWLQEVERGGWDGRYAAYDDDHISLEFALTREQAGPTQGVVAFCLGPFYAHHTLAAIERKVTFELDAWRMKGGGRRRPVLVCCVADQPWAINEGYLREAFLGKPTFTTTGQGPARNGFRGGNPSLFGDPQYECVGAVMMVERPVGAPTALSAKTWLNPWAERTLAPGAFASQSVLATVEEPDEETVVVAWQPPSNVPSR